MGDDIGSPAVLSFQLGGNGRRNVPTNPTFTELSRM